jgi:hypothetical protein
VTADPPLAGCGYRWPDLAACCALLSFGLRGDCNADGVVSAPDITACRLESFDDNGTFWADTLDTSPFLARQRTQG